MKALLITLSAALCLLFDAQAQSQGIRGFRSLRLGTAEFSPTNLPNLFGWWRPEGLTNLTDGLAVDYWIDSSGHDLHMRKVATSPLSTNNVLNGYRGVWFNGVNMSLTNAAAQTQTNTIFVVMSHGQIGDETVYLMSDNDGSANNGEVIYWSSGSTSNVNIGAGASFSVVGPYTNAFTTFTFQFSGASSRIYTNGVLAGTGAIGTENLDGGMTVGNYYTASINYLRCYVMEMFCVTNTFATQGTVLNDGCNYLRAKYRHY